MKLVVYQSTAGPRVAGLRDAQLVDLQQADPTLPHCVKALLAVGPTAIRRAAAALANGPGMALESVKLCPPVPSPEKIICVGLNYADHAAETAARRPAEPVLFNKFPTAASAHGWPIVLPADSREVDYEAELVAVIGVGGRRIPPREVRSHIAAYCCGNDVSARDWQLRKPGGQWLLGKSFDGFAPFGPWLTTADEIAEPGRLQIKLRLNGQTMQQSSTAQWIFGIEEVISYASRVCTLSPGDLVFTGTPGGVGFARTPPVFLKPGDVVEVEIERLGVLRNMVEKER
ncbi:MAG: fumarylacetoacetate hydrolase family protein [Thermoguttaceae bacterium]|jgi:2-keto-4-pentenoate hydratase/2-oxohepta-3-ene-1,7-dioic acid hydratase in catechol pathway